MANSIVIAVVDDDQFLGEALTGLIRSLGYAARAFTSAEELLESYELGELACIIADVHMGGMTGPELYDRLVTAGKRIPTILVTAYPDERTRQRVLDAGVACYLAKPFREDDLLACLRSVLKGPSEIPAD